MFLEFGGSCQMLVSESYPAVALEKTEMRRKLICCENDSNFKLKQNDTTSSAILFILNRFSYNHTSIHHTFMKGRCIL